LKGGQLPFTKLQKPASVAGAKARNEPKSVHTFAATTLFIEVLN
jgi:hypothetical protein